MLAEGTYAHPVWSPDGNAIGVTIFENPDDPDTEVLGYIPVDDPGNPVVVAGPAAGSGRHPGVGDPLTQRAGA